MAITASQITVTQTLEEFRLEYNKLQSDVEILKDNPTFSNQLVFEGITADAFETTFTVTDPTADRTVVVPDASGTLVIGGGAVSSFTLSDGGTFGVSSATDAMTVSAAGIVTFKDDIIIKDGGTIGAASATTAMTISSGGIVTFVDDILIKDGGTIGSASDADAITIASDGGVTLTQTLVGTAADFSGVATATTFEPDGDTASGDNAAIGYTSVEGIIITGQGSTNDVTIKNDADADVIEIPTGTTNVTIAGDLAIGGALTITGAAQTDIVQDTSPELGGDLDVLARDIVSSSNRNIDLSPHGSGVVRIDGNVDIQTGEIVLKNGGSVSNIKFYCESSNAHYTQLQSAAHSAYSGNVTLTLPATTGTLQLAGANITVADDGTIGSASDTNAIAISSAGVVTLSSSTASSSKTTGALVVTGGIGTSADLYVGDLLNVEGGINIAGSNQELRFYEGANYVGFEAPALSANQIWVLPAEDASDSGDVLMSDASGTLSWSTAVSGTASVFTVSANNSANETVFPVFVDGATGAQGAETDTGLTYNPSTGLMTMAKLLVADNGTIGSASATSAMTISSGGVVTFVDDIIIKDGGTIGSASDVDAITIDSSGNATFSQNLTVTGVTTLNGNLVLGDAAADTLTIGATLQGASPLVFEGGSANGHETTFAITDPTGDRTITFPDATGTVAISGQNITVADAGTIGSASDTDAISISAGGVVNISATTASTSKTSGALTVAGGLGVSLDAAIGDDLFMISDGAVITFGANSEIKLTHVHDTGLSITSTAAAPLVRRGEDVFIVLDGTDASSANAGDNVIMDASAASTDVGDDIIGEDEVFLHSGMQRNVINIRGSDGTIKNSVAGFAPGAI